MTGDLFQNELFDRFGVQLENGSCAAIVLDDKPIVVSLKSENCVVRIDVGLFPRLALPDNSDLLDLIASLNQGLFLNGKPVFYSLSPTALHLSALFSLSETNNFLALLEQFSIISRGANQLKDYLMTTAERVLKLSLIDSCKIKVRLC